MEEKREKQYVSSNINLMAEWNWQKNENVNPTQITIGSDKKVWWKCSKGHEWQATIASRNGGRGCPVCAKEKRNIHKKRYR